MKTLTYGTLPSREKFEAAFGALMAEGNKRWTQTPTRFAFANDPRVGTCELTCSELWGELVKAQEEYNKGPPVVDHNRESLMALADAAGQWCADVLGVLGFEWV